MRLINSRTAGPHVSRLADFELMVDQVVEEHRTLYPDVSVRESERDSESETMRERQCV